MLSLRPRATSLALVLAAPACFTPEDGSGATNGSSSSSTAGSTSTGQTASTATSDTDPQPTTTVLGTSTEPGTSGTATSDASITATVSSTDPVSTTGKDSECGNGVVEYDEMCDDGNILAGDCPADCQFAMPVRYVFLTSSVYTGNFGSVDAASNQCETLVAKELAADVLSGRKFVAWLSSSGQLAPSQLGSVGGPYVLLDGTMVADTTELFSSTLALFAPINVDETGAHVTARANDCIAEGSGVWTGTFEGGELGENCDGWTKDDPETYGTVGSFAIPDDPWTNCSTRPCSSLYHLYCIERA